MLNVVVHGGGQFSDASTSPIRDKIRTRFFEICSPVSEIRDSVRDVRGFCRVFPDFLPVRKGRCWRARPTCSTTAVFRKRRLAHTKSMLRVVVMFGTGVPDREKAETAEPGGRRARSPHPPPRPPRWRQATNNIRSRCSRCRGRTPSMARLPAMTLAPNGIRTYPNLRPIQRLMTVYYYAILSLIRTV